MTCGGCKKEFCYEHVIEHRQELTKQMQAVVAYHDQFQDTINEQQENVSKHPLIERVTQWETEAIEKVHQEASRVRQALFQTITTHTKKSARR